MPLVWDLTSEIKDWLTPEKLRELNENWRRQGSGYPQQVIDNLASMLTQPLAHYESILGYMEVQFRRGREFRQDYHHLYSWLVELVYCLLYYRQVNNEQFLTNNLPYYDGIKSFIDTDVPLWVFTLNHDVMIETMAARLSIPLHTGFSPNTIALPRRNKMGNKIGAIKAEILTKNDLENNAMYFPNPPQSGIYLQKIHGSLDTFTFNNGEDLLRLLPDELSQKGISDVLRMANEDLFYPEPNVLGRKAKTTNEITYADDNGEMQFLRRTLLAGAFKFDAYGSQVLPKSMLKHFKQNINFVSDLICIGYGFGDYHINSILRGWLEFSADRHLEIVLPGAQEIPNFLQHLVLQITVTQSTATDYLDNKAGIKRSTLEKLEKKTKSIFRGMDKDRRAEIMSAIAQKNQDELQKIFLGRLKAIPMANGKPDLSQLGELKEIAGQWVAEANLTKEALLKQMLAFVGKDDAAREN